MSSGTYLVSRSQLSLPHHYVTPADGDEAMIAKIWATALKLDLVGANDEFADLGGDSLDAEKVLAQIEIEAGVRVSVSTLIRGPTVALLAKEIERLRETSRSAGAL